jgi:hypothetical protein
MTFNPTFSLKYVSSNWAGNVPRYAVAALVGEYECGGDQVPSNFVSRGINAVPGEYHRFLLRNLISDGWIGRSNARSTATGIPLMMRIDIAESYGWHREYQPLALFSLSCDRLSLSWRFLLRTTSVWCVGARCNLVGNYSYSLGA